MQSESRALAFANELRNGSSTPFRDTVSNIFRATTNVAGIMCDATGYIRLETREILETRIAEAGFRAKAADHQALMDKLYAEELIKKMQEAQ